MNNQGGYIMRDQVRNRVADLMGYESRDGHPEDDGSGEQLPLFSITVVALYLVALSTSLG